MFGTVATMRVKPGQEQKIEQQMEQWWSERRPKVRGAIASTLYRSATNPNEYFIAVVFDSKESYEANANDPEQDQWYREMRDALEDEPHWYDGEIVQHKHV